MEIQNKRKEQWKKALREIRSIYKEYLRLKEEYNEDPTPHSPTLNEIKGRTLSQSQRFNDYTLKRELLKIKMNLCDEVIQEFMVYTMLLPSQQRQIIEVFITSESYAEMQCNIEEKCQISMSSYKIKMPLILLELDNIMDIDKMPTMQTIYEKYLEKVKDLKI